MARALPTLLVLALLGSTAAAFALTERLKLEKTPIYRTHVGRPIPGQPNRVGLPLFSPVCNCASDHVVVRFFLRRADTLTVTIEHDGDLVDTLVAGKRYRRGWVRLSWDGVQPTGIVVPDGSYDPVVHLAHERRTIALPNPITVDTTPPKLLTSVAKPLALSPDGDGRGDTMTVRYTANEKVRGLLFVDGKQRLEGKFPRSADALKFFGKVDGRPLPVGAYPLALAVRDRAGNLSKRAKLGALSIRYVSLGRPNVSIGPGQRFYIRVSADAARVQWRLGGRSGVAAPGTLVLRAPKQVGTYRLYVSVGEHAASARVKVERIG